MEEEKPETTHAKRDGGTSLVVLGEGGDDTRLPAASSATAPIQDIRRPSFERAPGALLARGEQHDNDDEGDDGEDDDEGDDEILMMVLVMRRTRMMSMIVM
eukprot:7826334-Pyramimonas_sp.AAC.1